MYYCIKKKCNYNISIVGKYRQIVDNGEVKPCLAACVDQTFELTVSSSSFPSEETFNHRPHFCVIVRWLQSISTAIPTPRHAAGS